MKKILTIAGSDSSGGAGIQADIKTIAAHRMYAMSVITALTAQNTTGVYAVQEVTGEFVAKQMDAVFTDIYPDAVKIGMVSGRNIIEVLSEKLTEYRAENIVLDPVMISTSGSRLLKEEAIQALISKLMPLARIITPNIQEAEWLCGLGIHGKTDMRKAALKLSEQYGADILIKGGHLEDCSDDLLYAGGEFYWFTQTRIKTSNTHGTGCTLSSAIACNLAAGMDIKSSIGAAKTYITGALRSGLDIGKGNGPLDHGWNIDPGFSTYKK